jgi:hypothetical protein
MKKFIFVLIIFLFVLSSCKTNTNKPTSSAFISSSSKSKTYVKDKSLETKIAKEADEFIEKLIVEDIPPVFSKIEELDKNYAETIALFETLKNNPQKDDNWTTLFFPLSDVIKSAKSIFGDTVQISNNGSYGFEFKPEKTGYEMYGFGIEAGYYPFSMKCIEENNTVFVYIKLIFLSDGFYENSDQKKYLSNDITEAAFMSTTPLYKVTLIKKSTGGFYFMAFQKENS